jgi:hypothetical protein
MYDELRCSDERLGIPFNLGMFGMREHTHTHIILSAHI